jgi:hypothetical protein
MPGINLDEALLVRVADPDPHYFWKLDGSGSRVKSWIRIRIRKEVKIQDL